MTRRHSEVRAKAKGWIAATALYLEIPLVSHDRLFTGTPGLVFETAP